MTGDHHRQPGRMEVDEFVVGVRDIQDPGGGRVRIALQPHPQPPGRRAEPEVDITPRGVPGRKSRLESGAAHLIDGEGAGGVLEQPDGPSQVFAGLGQRARGGRSRSHAGRERPCREQQSQPAL